MSPSSPIIDVHSHYIPSPLGEAASQGATRHGVTFARNDLGHLVYTVNGQTFMLAWPSHNESADERVAAMDRAGVEIQLVSMAPNMHAYDLDAKHGVSFAHETNDDLADLVAAQPSRLRGLAFLPLQDPALAVTELGRIMANPAFVGAMVSTNVNGMVWDDPSLFPVLESAEELGAFIFVHPARPRSGSLFPKYHLRNVIGLPVETTTTAACLIFGGVLDRLPDLKICLAHGGGYTCFAIGRFDHAAAVRHDAVTENPPSDYLRRFYYDSLTHSEPALRYVVDRVGADRMVLGTDYPADMGVTSPVEWVKGLGSLTTEEKGLLLGQNMAELLGPRLPQPIG